jgi:hypothetical protein
VNQYGVRGSMASGGINADANGVNHSQCRHRGSGCHILRRIVHDKAARI